MFGVRFSSMLLLACFACGIRANDAASPVKVTLETAPLPSTPGLHVIKGKAAFEKTEFPIAFDLFLPPAYFASQEPFPLVVTLHNSVPAIGGADGNPQLCAEGLAQLMVLDIDKEKRVAETMPPNPVNVHKAAKFIGLIPQCPKDKGFEAFPMNQVVLQLIDEVGKRYRMDPDRVYLTGFSYGGGCAWALAMEAPERFAAVVPLSARAAPTPEKAAERLKNVGVWIGVGDQDGRFFQACNEMNDVLTQGKHPNLHYTVIKGGQHHCYPMIYGDPAFWDWLYAQHRNKK